MKRIIIIIISIIAFVLVIIFFVQNRANNFKIANRINEYVLQMNDFETIVIGFNKSEMKSVKFFMKSFSDKYKTEYQFSTTKLVEKYKSERSYIFFLTNRQKEEMRKTFPRMSFIEIKNSTFLFSDEVFFISKNKCNCE